MTFELSREHEEFRRSVREFAEAEIAPHAAQWDKDHHFPSDVVQKMGDLGLFGLTAPEEYGGAGDFTSLCVAIEEIGRVDQGMGITLESAVGLGINPILNFGTKDQKERWLPDLVAGQTLAGFGLTEPASGSDAGDTRTKADLVEGEWVINGAKQFITNSGSALTSVVTVTARTGTRPDGTAEVSSILVPAGTEGFVAEPAYNKLGWHCSDTHPLTFTGARVPEDHLLGERGRGFAQFLATLDDGRVAEVRRRKVLGAGQLVEAEAPMVRLALDQRVAERPDVPGRDPDLGVHEDSRVEPDDVVPLLDHRLPPGALDVVLQLDAERTVVPDRVDPAVDLGRREDEAAPLRERDDGFEAGDGRRNLVHSLLHQ